MTRTLTPEEILAWQPYALTDDGQTALERARQRMQEVGQWAPWQALGRRYPIGCVALEITQRCNLDCTLCYLSESSNALKDIPLQEVFRRIDLIHAHYGDNTDIQVTGGDPTLRKREELVQIVRYIRARNMRCSLFTNGIKATRDLLAELAATGLTDVAFHVDMTQQRPGYGSEIELNAIRQEYIERARGLPLSVFFNTTVYPVNVHEVPDVVRFFIDNCDVVRMCSFQIGAKTGRGVGHGGPDVTARRVMTAIQQGAGTPLNFDAAGCGPAACNRYAYALVVNGRAYDFFNDPKFVQKMLAATAHLHFDRTDRRRAIETMTDFLLEHPRLLAASLSRAARLAWKARKDLLAARARVGKLSFFVHNFMDACHLDADRIAACSFMVMTPEGPLSMCLHNAKRDDYLLVPAAVHRENRAMFWNPTTGALQERKPERIAVTLTRKNARGRAKAELRTTAVDVQGTAPTAVRATGRRRTLVPRLKRPGRVAPCSTCSN